MNKKLEKACIENIQSYLDAEWAVENGEPVPKKVCNLCEAVPDKDGTIGNCDICPLGPEYSGCKMNYKFRKKPVVIEAFQFNGSTTHFGIIEAWMNGNDLPRYDYVCTQDCGRKIEIETLEGVMTAQMGDWIIKGVNGEFYPCKPDIFEKTYEPANEEKVEIQVGTIHYLKTENPWFSDILNGEKNFEVRKDDRKFQVGDQLRLTEWDPDTKMSGRSITVDVVYKVNGGQFGIHNAYCVLGIKRNQTQ